MLIAVLILGTIGLLAGLILYFVSSRFAVIEDERCGIVTNLLPGANCGGCGFAGCSGFAGACVKAADAGSLGTLYCNVGGADVMSQVAEALHLQAVQTSPKVAVVRCNGSCENRARVVTYDGRRTCADMHLCGAGETLCGYGCLGCGDCVDTCKFDAIHINPQTLLPEVDDSKCTACGGCAKACPRHVIEIRTKGIKDRRVFVACVNKDKGPAAKKACTAACIGCGLCAKQCKFEAISIEGNLSYIHPDKCRLCRSCVSVCPTHAIHEVNFPVKAVKQEDNHL